MSPKISNPFPEHFKISNGCATCRICNKTNISLGTPPANKNARKNMKNHLKNVHKLSYSYDQNIYKPKMVLTKPQSLNIVKTEKNNKNADVKKLASEPVKKFNALLGNAKWISLTTHTWRNLTNTSSLLSIEAHFLENFTMNKVILTTKVIEENLAHNIEKSHIETDIENTINEFSKRDNIHMVILDNASRPPVRYGSYVSIGCVAHTLQLVLNDVFFKNTAPMTIIEKCRNIVKCLEQDATLNLVQDVENRWKSTYLMLESLINQKSAIDLYTTMNDEKVDLTEEDWRDISDCATILIGFNQAINDASQDSSTVSLIIPLIVMLKSKLAQQSGDSENIKQLKSALKESIDQRFDYARQTLELLVATIIDPRFKTKYLTTDEIANAKTEMLRYMHPKSNTLLTDGSDVKMENPGPSSSTRNATTGNDLWESHDRTPANEDLRSYLEDPLLDRDKNIFEYWASSQYGSLQSIAIKFLSAPPTCMCHKLAQTIHSYQANL